MNKLAAAAFGAVLLVVATLPAQATVLELPIPVTEVAPGVGFTYVDSIGGSASGFAVNNGPADFNLFNNVFTTDFGLLGANEANGAATDVVGTFTASATSGASPLLDATLISSLSKVTLNVTFALTSGSPPVQVSVTNVTTGATAVVGDLDPTLTNTAVKRVFNITDTLKAFGEGQYAVTLSYSEARSRTRRFYFGFTDVVLTVVTP